MGVWAFGHFGAMDADLESLMNLSAIGGDEEALEEESIFGDGESIVGDGDMPAPERRLKKKMCEACLMKFLVTEWARSKFRGPLCNGCNVLRLLRLPWMQPDQLLVLLSDGGKRQWWVMLRTGNPALATMEIPTTKENVVKTVTNRLRIVGNEEVYVPSDNFTQRVKVEDLGKITYMGKTYYGLKASADKAPKCLRVVPETLVAMRNHAPA